MLLAKISAPYAQNICAPFLEQTVQPVSASVLWPQLAKVPSIKDEYETTPAFEARVAKAMGAITAPVIVEVPIQREFITYNADANRLDIQSYVFSNGTTKYDGVFGYGTTFYGKIQYGSFDNIDVVFPHEEKNQGSYLGTTAMGLKIRVTKLKRTTKVIFEGKDSSTNGLFLSRAKHDAPVLSFNDITPDMAKHIKTTARAAIVFVPKSPYFAKGKFPWGEPSIEGPMEIDESIEVVIADIQCALFLNSKGKVFGVVATQ